MSGIGSLEIMLIILVALLVVGPDKTKEAISLFGKSLRVLRQTIEKVKNNLQQPEEVKEFINGAKENMDLSNEVNELQSEVNQVKKIIGGKEK